MIVPVLLFVAASVASANNLHLIESNPNGFAIYRTSKPDAKDMRELCRIGVQEMMVLSGDAEKHEFKYQSECPTLKVIYNEDQHVDIPVTADFLHFFDKWVADAQTHGKKIAFRCQCGCHRTGRLAAYYQMKYQNLTLEDAQAIMDEHGKFMWLHGQLKPQTQALYDYIKGEPCSVDEKYCVIP
jgi:hypothetical protein